MTPAEKPNAPAALVPAPPDEDEMAELIAASERSIKIAEMLHRIADRKPRIGPVRKSHCPYCKVGVISWIQHHNGHIHARIECGCAPNFME